MFFVKGTGLLIFLVTACYGDFLIPPVTLEAYKPKGFRASIRALPDIDLFAFHGNVNKEISQIEPGELSEDIKAPEGGFFTYYNPELNLSVGSVVNYWVFVQHKQLGYRKEAQTWTATELLTEPGQGCNASITEVSDKTKVCTGSVLLADEFEDTKIDEKKWTLEQYIPARPDFSFVVYKKDESVYSLKDGKFIIKPMLIENEEELKQKFLNVSDGCTRSAGQECTRKLYLIQNPIVSAKISSKITFKYGIFEVKAKLPAGDWIFPEIYLEDETYGKILIAYVRGNENLKKDNADIGSNVLYAGPAAKRPNSNRADGIYKNANGPLNKAAHVYRIVWTPENIELFLDGTSYAVLNTKSINDFTGNKMMRLVLGLGVGGITDFPDGSMSNGIAKPWKNSNAKQVKEFHASRSVWYKTWEGSSSQLQVDYVKVIAA